MVKRYQIDNQLTVKSFVSLDEIESDMASSEPGLVIIDFIQNAIDYVKGDGYKTRSKNRQYSMRCKSLADYKCCMVLLSQFSKPVDKRTKLLRTMH